MGGTTWVMYNNCVAQLLQTRHLFRVVEYEMMGDIFDEDARVVLIEGEIVDMVPIGPRHQEYVDRLTRLCLAHWDNSASVRVQGPIQLGEFSEVQPDIALLRKKLGGYAETHPGPSDVLLVIEVSDTTLARDLEKSNLYARSGIEHCWILDANKQELMIMRNPTPNGYADQRRIAANENPSDPIEPGKSLDTSSLFDPSIQ